MIFLSYVCYHKDRPGNCDKCNKEKLLHILDFTLGRSHPTGGWVGGWQRTKPFHSSSPILKETHADD